MDTLMEITEYGISLGYAGSELKQFVTEQQDHQREERRLKREKEREQREHDFSIVKYKMDNELKMKELEHAHEVEMLQKQAELKGKG